MRRGNPGPGRYAPAARLLHWGVAAAVLAMFALGLWMTTFAPADGATRHRLFNLHESLGVTVLGLMLVRLAFRLARSPPPLPAGVPGGVRQAARLNHVALYALLLAMPAVGYLTNSAQGAGLVWFEAVPLPQALPRDPAVAHGLAGLHAWGALVLAGLIALHWAGALYHGAVRRDGVVRRML